MMLGISDSILSFDKDNLVWKEVGHMTEVRSFHGINIVHAEDVLYYCVPKK